MGKKIETVSLEPSDVSAITGEYITEELLKARNNKVVVNQLFKKAVLPKGFSTGVVPKVPVASLNVYSISAGGSIAESSYAYGGVTVTPTKRGIYISVQNEALKQSARPIMKELTSEFSDAITTDLDLSGMTVALGLVSETIDQLSFSGGTLASGLHTPIVRVDSITGQTISSVDYYEGKMLLSGSMSAGTVVYTYSSVAENNGLYVVTGTAKTITANDILTVRGSLNANSLSADVVLVNDIDLPNLMDSSNGIFVNAEQYTDKESLLNGEKGQLVDLKVLSSPNVPRGISVVLDSSRLGYDVTARDLWVTVEDYPTNDEQRLRVWIEQIYSYGDTMSLGIVTGGQANAGDLE
jgi:hypothetical protein